MKQAFFTCQKPTVSTHSRLKAAGERASAHWYRIGRFNTQPPEGGWQAALERVKGYIRFNTQPPEGGWLRKIYLIQV